MKYNTTYIVNQLSLRQKILKELYKDIPDNEYNCCNLQFIFGVTIDGTTDSSFSTINKFAVYFDRDTTKYYIDLDVNYIADLNEIESLFTDYMKNNNYSTSFNSESYIEEFSYFSLCGGTIEELYNKFEILYRGYNAYV